MLTGDDPEEVVEKLKKTGVSEYAKINLGNLTIGDYLSGGVLTVAERAGLIEKERRFDPSMPVISTIDDAIGSAVGVGGELFAGEDRDWGKLGKHSYRFLANLGRLRGWQITPVVTQSVRAYDSYLGEPEHLAEFRKLRRDIKDTRESDRTPQQWKELDTLDSFNKEMGTISREISADNKIIKEVTNEEAIAEAKERIKKNKKLLNQMAARAMVVIKGLRNE